MELKKRILIINILFIGILVLYFISGSAIISATISDEVEIMTILSGWINFMNNFGLTFSKTLVLLIFPVAVMGIINFGKLERDQKITVGKIASFSSIIILFVSIFFDLIYYAYLGSTRQAFVQGKFFLFISFDAMNLILYIIIFVFMSIKTE